MEVTRRALWDGDGELRRVAIAACPPRECITISGGIDQRKGGRLCGVCFRVTLSLGPLAASEVIGDGITIIKADAEVMANVARESIAGKIRNHAAEVGHSEGAAGIVADGAAEGEHVGTIAALIVERAPRGVELTKAGNNLAECYAHVDGIALAVPAARDLVVVEHGGGSVIDQGQPDFEVLEVPIIGGIASSVKTDIQVVDGCCKIERAGVRRIISR